MQTEITPATEPLSEAELDNLVTLERCIRDGQEAFLQVGNALAEIRDRRLYRANHSTFEQYLYVRWSISKAHGYRLITAAEVSKTVSPGGDKPLPESHARELAPIAPDRRQQIYDAASKATGGAPTAAAIRDAAMADTLPDGGPSNAVAAQTSSKSVEWYTPQQYLDAVYEVFGGIIDCDPASCEEAQARIQADTYFTEADDGLAQKWHGRVFLNPPYGKDRETYKSTAGIWTAAAFERFEQLEIDEIIELVNAATGARWWSDVLVKCSVCFVEGRIEFDAPSELGEDPSQPTQYSVFAYRGPAHGHELFQRVFSRFGHVVPFGAVVKRSEP